MHPAHTCTHGLRAARPPQIPSDKVVFNEKPDMKAREITEAGKEALKSGRYQMVRINYANPDMVGHTGAGCPGGCSVCTSMVRC